ncbi:hypothetical protein T4D_14685, partial [Trichinella pseudospiralis]
MGSVKREIIKELDEEDLLNVKEKWCVVLKTNDDKRFKSTVGCSVRISSLFMVALGAGKKFSLIQIQFYNKYNRPEVSRNSTDEKYSKYRISLFKNVQAAAAVVSSVPDDSWLTLQSTLQQLSGFSEGWLCRQSWKDFWIFRFVVKHVLSHRQQSTMNPASKLLLRKVGIEAQSASILTFRSTHLDTGFIDVTAGDNLLPVVIRCISFRMRPSSSQIRTQTLYEISKTARCSATIAIIAKIFLTLMIRKTIPGPLESLRALLWGSLDGKTDRGSKERRKEEKVVRSESLSFIQLSRITIRRYVSFKNTDNIGDDNHLTDKRFKSTVGCSVRISSLFMVALGAGKKFSLIQIQFYNKYNRPEVSRYSTDEKYSKYIISLFKNVQAAAAVVSSVPDDSWLTLQSTLQQPCQVIFGLQCFNRDSPLVRSHRQQSSMNPVSKLLLRK